MPNYSVQLEKYRQSGNICTFLDMFFYPYADVYSAWDLPGKFAAFETAGFHLSNNSILESLMPSIFFQFSIAQCQYENLLFLSNNSIYVEENDPYGRYPMVLDHLVPALVAIMGILFNLSLLIVTARKIALSTMCNWLLAFDSICQIPAVILFPVNVLPFYAPFFSVNRNASAIDYRVCLTLEMLATGFSNAAFLAVYFISLERLLIVLMPMRMSQFSEKKIKYFSLVAILACLCFGVAMILIIFRFLPSIITQYDRFIICDRQTLSGSFMYYGDELPYVTIMILCLALLNYVFIAGVIVWRRIYVPSTQADSNNNAAHTQATYRMLRSVFIISLIVLIGWLFGVVLILQIHENIIGPLAEKIALIFYTDIYDAPGGRKLLISLTENLKGLLNCLFPIAAGLNAPVLVINNSDYREAYKKTLAPLLKMCRKRRATVAVVGVGPLFTDQHNQ